MDDAAAFAVLPSSPPLRRPHVRPAPRSNTRFNRAALRISRDGDKRELPVAVRYRVNGHDVDFGNRFIARGHAGIRRVREECLDLNAVTRMRRATRSGQVTSGAQVSRAGCGALATLRATTHRPGLESDNFLAVHRAWRRACPGPRRPVRRPRIAGRAR